MTSSLVHPSSTATSPPLALEIQDSNEDGKGDLIGLQSSLDYVKSLDVGAISLSSFFQTAPSNESTDDPSAIAGKDVTEFMEPDSAIGTLKDVKDLVKKARKMGLKVLLEIDPNHSSDQHKYFLDSAAGLAAMKVWMNLLEWPVSIHLALFIRALWNFILVLIFGQPC